MTEVDLNFALSALLWGAVAHVIMGGVIGIIPRRPGTAYVILLVFCIAEALVVAGGVTVFGGAFIAMAAPDDEPLRSSTGLTILALFAVLFLASLVLQSLPTLCGAWLARRLFRRPQK